MEMEMDMNDASCIKLTNSPFFSQLPYYYYYYYNNK